MGVLPARRCVSYPLCTLLARSVVWLAHRKYHVLPSAATSKGVDGFRNDSQLNASASLYITHLSWLALLCTHAANVQHGPGIACWLIAALHAVVRNHLQALIKTGNLPICCCC
eukprot:GHRR01019043.1.p3 GENE.GHRR01019043.1~~GHRR01019043.1.p3  ORF type:complete len:113 (-),score=15.74 GHRR01019043.1:970-1308(-)